MSRVDKKTKLLEYIAKHTAVSMKDMRVELGISTSSLYYQLATLAPFLKRDKSKRYYLNADTRLLLEHYDGDYTAIGELLKRPRMDSSMPEFRKYRNLYDGIASILDTRKPVFTIVDVVRRAKLPHNTAKRLLSLLKQKGLVIQVQSQAIPSTYARSRRTFFTITERGGVFVRRYRLLKGMIS